MFSISMSYFPPLFPSLRHRLCIIHRANFRALPELYAFAFVFVSLPWAVVATRQAILVPCGPFRDRLRLYCLIYETIFSRPIFRNHVFLQFLAVLGFYRSEYFTLMLLDVVNINQVKKKKKKKKSDTTTYRCISTVLVNVFCFLSFTTSTIRLWGESSSPSRLPASV